MWIREVRPDGARALWRHLGRWYTLTWADGYRLSSGRDCLRVSVFDHAAFERAAFVEVGVTAPSAEDLAWLRGGV